MPVKITLALCYDQVVIWTKHEEFKWTLNFFLLLFYFKLLFTPAPGDGSHENLSSVGYMQNMT